MPSPDSSPSSKADGGPRRALVVLGMHRSGTSAIAGSLHRLGVDFGPRLMPATSANERGYYEHIDVVNLHDRLLLALDSSWDETLSLPDHWWLDDARTGSYRAEMLALLRRDFSNVPFWGLKDPRLCRLLPWWEPIWLELDTRPLYLIVLRDPRAIAASLLRRDGFSVAKALLLWLQHLIEAERWTRNQPRVFVDFESFLSDPTSSLNSVSEALDCPWPRITSQPQTENEPFLDKSLRQILPTQGQETLPRWVERVDAALRLEAMGKPGEPTLSAEMDRVSEQLREAAILYDPMLRQRAADLGQQLSAQQSQGQWYEKEWMKAREREMGLQGKLLRAQEKEKILRKRIIEKEDNISIMRINYLSKLIKPPRNRLFSWLKNRLKFSFKHSGR